MPEFSPLRSGKLKIAALSLLLIGGLSAWPIYHRFSRDKVEFSRDIRPIFNQNCVACHGGVRQKNGVSFIFREEALGSGKIRKAHHRAGRSRRVRVDGARNFE